jgi:hypothetical protein
MNSPAKSEIGSRSENTAKTLDFNLEHAVQRRTHFGIELKLTT